MTQSRTQGSQALRRVLSFTFRQWAGSKRLAAQVALGMALGTLSEVVVPVFAGRLVDAVGKGSGAVREAAIALAAMASLGLVMLVCRHIAWSSIVPFTLRIMRNISQGAFYRVQRFSTDWHNNSFAGSIVRKITRGMWALDSVDDTLLLMMLPSLVVLVGTVVLLAFRWPVMGVVMGIGSIAY